MTHRVQQNATSLWAHVAAIKGELTNPGFVPDFEGDGLVLPQCSMKRLELWSGYYLRYRSVLRLLGALWPGALTRISTDADDGPRPDPAAVDKHNMVVWVDDEDSSACRSW